VPDFDPLALKDAMTTPEPPAKANPQRALPGYYNDLDASLEHAWAMLVRGVSDRRAAFHTPVVATVDERGEPSQRVMVLRAVDPAARLLRFHTDVRSHKLRQLERNPRVTVLFYDTGTKLQLRVGARAELHINTDASAAAWAKSAKQSRLCYEQTVPPGKPIATPLPEWPPEQRFAAGDDGKENFAVLHLTADSIEWLYLAIEGHRRAHWCWDGKAWVGSWLAP
jgi:pyridoxamine 5'-phosphate oxidase